jgi:xylulokinase
MFHPYLSGERTPLNDANARAGFIGLARSHTNAEMAYAVLEGVSYAMAECADVLAKIGQGPSSLLAVGGGSKNHQWLQLMADTTGLTIHLPMEGEFGGALGAARLGAIASGASLTDILTKPNIKHIFHPRNDYCGFHNEKRNRWRATYNAIKSLQSRKY